MLTKWRQIDDITAHYAVEIIDITIFILKMAQSMLLFLTSN